MKYVKRLVLTTVIILAAALGTAYAQSSAEHTVQSGETLFQIADKYDVTVQQIKDWNNLQGSQLSIGQVLTIRKSDSDNSREGTSGTVHTVKEKETLYSISKKYGVGIADLKQWNNISANNLAVGSKLTIRSEQSNASATSSSIAPKSSYTVKSGDSLFRIARIHNMTVERLKQINNLSSNTIQVGQQLSVQPTDQPPSLTKAGVESSSQGKFIRHTLDKSQNLSELLQSFQMSREEFKALNPGLSDTAFRKGRDVTLLAPANESFKNPYAINNTMSSLGSASASPYESQEIVPTTSGELYNPSALTAAHPNIAMGSIIFVKNSTNNCGVLVRINDRTTGESLKLSRAAWQALALSGGENRVTLFRNE